MTTWEELQRKRDEYQKLIEKGGELTKCEKCGNTWFSSIAVSQYLDSQPSIIGQALSIKPGQTPFHMLVCVTCQNIQAPVLLRGARDYLNKEYDEFLDQIDEAKKMKEQQTTKPVKEKVKIDEV